MKFKTYNSEANYIIKIVKQASKLISRGRKNHMECSFKGHDDLVTNLDLECEKFLTQKMQQRFPGYSVVSEEYNSKEKVAENCFTIDPIDGTTNFANHLGHWSIQVALISGGKNIVSVLYFPTENELFVATLGGGAFLNGEPIKVNTNPETQTLYNFVISHKLNVDDLDMMRDLKPISRHARMLGSQSCAFAYTACGRLKATFFGYYTRWDIEPGRLLVLEAGGTIIDRPGKYILAASTSEIATAFDDVAKKYFNVK